MLKLDAVNQCLRALGWTGVRALDTDGISDAAIAEQTVDEMSLKIQTMGWYYNTRRQVPLTPDSAGNIALPDGCITIDTDGVDAWREVTQLGDRLYDLDNNTNIFTVTSLSCTYTLNYQFGCIPEPIQEYITAMAAHAHNERYQQSLTRRQVARQSLIQEIARAKAVAMRFEDSTSDVNFVNSVEMLILKGQRNRVTT